MTASAISLEHALNSFDDEWSPRIVTRVNDYDVRVVKIRGEFVWHRHLDTDEFFHVLHGEVDIAMREADGREHVVHLQQGSVFTVPRGVEHKPQSTHGASMLLFEPSGTVNTGDREGQLPAHIQSTTGQPLADGGAVSE